MTAPDGLPPHALAEGDPPGGAPACEGESGPAARDGQDVRRRAHVGGGRRPPQRRVRAGRRGTRHPPQRLPPARVGHPRRHRRTRRARAEAGQLLPALTAGAAPSGRAGPRPGGRHRPPLRRPRPRSRRARRAPRGDAAAENRGHPPVRRTHRPAQRRWGVVPLTDMPGKAALRGLNAFSRFGFGSGWQNG